MFKVEENDLRIEMNKGDFGVILTVNFDDIADTNIKFIISDLSKNAIIEKPFDNITDNKIDLVLTEEETAKLDVGTYTWSLYQYVKNKLKNTLVVGKTFKVKEGA